MDLSVTDAAAANFSGTFTPAAGGTGNYAKFTITAAEFSVSAIPSASSNPTLRAPLNAIQIVPR